MQSQTRVYKSLSSFKVELNDLSKSMELLQIRADNIKLDLQRISEEIQKIKSLMNTH